MAHLQSTRFTFTTLLLFWLACCLCACDDSLQSLKDPIVKVTPAQFLFPSDQLTKPITSTVTIENISNQGLLKLAYFNVEFDAESAGNLELYWYRQGDEAHQFEGFVGGQSKFPNVIEIDPSEEGASDAEPAASEKGAVVLALTYTPRTKALPKGQITFQTNDPDQLKIELPIRSEGFGPEIYVTPQKINFEDVTANNEFTQTLTIQNLGHSPLVISDIELYGSEHFKLRNGSSPISGEFLSDPDRDGEPGLASLNRFELTVVYKTDVVGFEAAEFRFLSNDSRKPSVSVELTANGSIPCIKVPNEFRFSATRLGQKTENAIEIENCGGHKLNIKSIAFSEQSDPVFNVDAETLGKLPHELGASALDADGGLIEGGKFNATIRFIPTEDREFEGELFIDYTEISNLGTESNLFRISVPVSGKGRLNQCPVARVLNKELEVKPLDIITLNASASTDPDGPGQKPIRYHWTVIERPQGSTSQPLESFASTVYPANGGLTDDSTTPEALFFVDLAGEYTIELVVEDVDQQAPSEECPQEAATIHLTAIPDKLLHVQLVWHTPADENERDDDGADLDLHMRHPRGSTWGNKSDCNYQNPNPDWGEQGSANDPSLDIDDQNGAGPENINLDDPQNTDELRAPYLVGVHYYRAEYFDITHPGTWGPSIATVRIYIDGVQKYEASRQLDETDNFWLAAEIHTTPSEQTVTNRDEFYQKIPID